MYVLNGVYGQSDTYSFTFTVTNGLDQNCIIVLEVPSQITILDPDCSENYSGFSQPPTCTKNGRQITVSGKIVTGNTQFSLQFKSFLN